MNNGDDHWHRDLGRCILRNSHGDSRGDLRGDSGGDQIEVVAHDQGQRNAIAVRIKGYKMQSVFCKGSGRRFCIEEDGGALKPKTGTDAAIVVVQCWRHIEESSLGQGKMLTKGPKDGCTAKNSLG